MVRAQRPDEGRPSDVYAPGHDLLRSANYSASLAGPFEHAKQLAIESRPDDVRSTARVPAVPPAMCKRRVDRTPSTLITCHIVYVLHSAFVYLHIVTRRWAANMTAQSRKAKSLPIKCAKCVTKEDKERKEVHYRLHSSMRFLRVGRRRIRRDYLRRRRRWMRR